MLHKIMLIFLLDCPIIFYHFSNSSGVYCITDHFFGGTGHNWWQASRHALVLNRVLHRFSITRLKHCRAHDEQLKKGIEIDAAEPDDHRLSLLSPLSWGTKLKRKAVMQSSSPHGTATTLKCRLTHDRLGNNTTTSI